MKRMQCALDGFDDGGAMSEEMQWPLGTETVPWPAFSGGDLSPNPNGSQFCQDLLAPAPGADTLT